MFAGQARADSQLAYAEFTSSYTPTTTTAATATAIVTAAAVTTNGTERVCVEFSAPYWANATTNSTMSVEIYDGSTDLGKIAYYLPANTAVANLQLPVYGVRCVVPSSGSHTYSARGWYTSSAGSIFAGAGGAGNVAPGTLRVISDITPAATVAWNDVTSKPTFNLDWLTDVATAGESDGDVLKYDSGASLWTPGTDLEGAGGGAGLTTDEHDALNLVWYGVWALVGLALVGFMAAPFLKVFRITHGIRA